MATRILQKTKDFREVLDYDLDWSEWLEVGDTLSTSNWVVPSGITKDSDGNDTTSTTIWLSAGTVGESYVMVNIVTTAQSRTGVAILIIKVIDKADV